MSLGEGDNTNNNDNTNDNHVVLVARVCDFVWYPHNVYVVALPFSQP